jgi:predicted O-methyltransferase YrrM
MDKDYNFTHNWFYGACQYWPVLFSHIGWNREEPKTILEIGSFEGQSTCWILDNLIGHKSSKVFCLDTFEGGVEHQKEDFNLDSLSDRFLYNISQTGKEDFVQVLVGDSKQSLCYLVDEGLIFDFIYIDGSHQAKDVLADAVISWILLRRGGLLIFDDYLWENSQADILLTPKLAIDSFINCYRKEISFISTPQNYQVCLLKE